MTLPAQYSINHRRFSALYYKTGFVLDNFTQLWANVSVLSMFKVGQAKMFGMLGALTAFSTMIFSNAIRI